MPAGCVPVARAGRWRQQCSTSASRIVSHTGRPCRCPLSMPNPSVGARWSVHATGGPVAVATRFPNRLDGVAASGEQGCQFVSAGGRAGWPRPRGHSESSRRRPPVRRELPRRFGMWLTGNPDPSTRFGIAGTRPLGHPRDDSGCDSGLSAAGRRLDQSEIRHYRRKVPGWVLGYRSWRFLVPHGESRFGTNLQRRRHPVPGRCARGVRRYRLARPPRRRRRQPLRHRRGTRPSAR